MFYKIVGQYCVNKLSYQNILTSGRFFKSMALGSKHFTGCESENFNLQIKFYKESLASEHLSGYSAQIFEPLIRFRKF